MSGEPPEGLIGGNMGNVVRMGDTVVREAGVWTPAVHRLLSHLNAAGVPGVPRPLGIVAGDREVLSFVEGTVPAHPMPAWVWSENALDSATRLLRQIHDATEGSHLDGPWRTAAHEPAEVICHNDFATYNLVFEGDRVVGIIDWDFASPGPRLWDLAYFAYRIVPLTTADWGDTFDPVARQARLLRILNVYGAAAPPGEVIDLLKHRLHELAQFTDLAAKRIGNPELDDHADLYRRDAANLGRDP